MKRGGGRSSPDVAPSPTPARQRPPDPPGTVNGSQNPELVPDRVAYSILFRFLSDRQSEDEKNSMRFYLRQKLGGGDCDATEEEKAATDNVIDALLTAATEFSKQVAPLDSEAKSLKDKHWPNPSSDVMGSLARLQARKDAAVLKLAASLRGRFTGKVKESAKLERLIHENLKRKIKITPSPQSPPGGPGWREANGRHH